MLYSGDGPKSWREQKGTVNEKDRQPDSVFDYIFCCKCTTFFNLLSRIYSDDD